MPSDDGSSVGSKPKKLATSSSMYYKPFEPLTRSQDFKSKSADPADIMGKCALFDITTTSVFEGGKSLYSIINNRYF
jgi:hypothetical protein